MTLGQNNANLIVSIGEEHPNIRWGRTCAYLLSLYQIFPKFTDGHAVFAFLMWLFDGSLALAE
jgi:hypothetical protein